METSFKKPKKKVDPAAADALAASLADRTYDKPKSDEKVDELLKPMQFKFPASFHKEVKAYALEKDMTMTELFRIMYAEYRQKHG